MTKTKAIILRALKTFIQSFCGCLVAFNVSDLNNLKTVLTSAVISAVISTLQNICNELPEVAK